MGHSDIGVTLNTYTHLGLEDAEDELAGGTAECQKGTGTDTGRKTVSQKMFKAI